MNILFLSAWYPNRYDAMAGLFVRKHAQAVARQKGCKVDVLYICEHEEVSVAEFEEETVDGVSELVYYHTPFRTGVERIRAIRRAWLEWRKRRRKLPDVVHLNVITKMGWLARYLQWRYGVPYVVTEHWSGYLPEDGDFKGWTRVNSTKWIAAGAAAIMPVSRKLMEAMQGHGLRNKKWMVVNNVIDDFFYETATDTEPHDKFRFVHVSCFDNRPKNTVGIVEAVERLKEMRSDFEIIMIGTGKDLKHTVEEAEMYGLTENSVIRFTGELTPQEVKRELDNGDCFVLFSNYENAPVVFGEALTCGLPIISSPAGNAEEIVNKHCGEIVPYRDTVALAEAMNRMIDNAARYDKDYIRRDSHEFSFDTVGRQFVDVYRQAIHKQQ